MYYIFIYNVYIIIYIYIICTFWTEKKLKALIEKIIARALDEQQKNLFNIISGNFKILK